MNITPPPGSRISVMTDGGGAPIIVIPWAKGRNRILVALAFTVWLVVWGAGEMLAVMMISSDLVHGFRVVFLVIWLLLWTIAGIFSVVFTYRALRPLVPESLHLASMGIEFDSGIRRPRLVPEGLTPDGLPNYFPKRVHRTITLPQLKSLSLDQFAIGTRLIVEIDGDVVEIASGASDAERQWLAHVLIAYYGLTHRL